MVAPLCLRVASGNTLFNMQILNIVLSFDSNYLKNLLFSGKWANYTKPDVVFFKNCVFTQPPFSCIISVY